MGVGTVPSSRTPCSPELDVVAGNSRRFRVEAMCFQIRLDLKSLCPGFWQCGEKTSRDVGFCSLKTNLTKKNKNPKTSKSSGQHIQQKTGEKTDTQAQDPKRQNAAKNYLRQPNTPPSANDFK